MKNALIIGAAGFVGRYLADHLYNSCKWSVCATKLPHEKIDLPYADVCDLNILNVDEIKDLLIEKKPDYIFHLAAQSSVALSWKNPSLTVDVNVKGAVNLLEAVRQTELSPRILVIGSGEEYGKINSEDCPINESVAPNPQNIYAVTKLCQENICMLYAKAYNMDIMAVRAFNHIGAGQTPQFVAADFASQIANIEKGEQPAVISVGNLSAKRDFTDVRDIVRAYAMLVEKGKSGEIYNVGSGKAIEINELLKILLSFSDKDIEVVVDEKKLRPIDVPIIEADISKITKDTGWKPEIDVHKTLLSILNSFREG